MIDIETLGLHPGSSIISIGAVFFDLLPRSLLTEPEPEPITFYVNVDRTSCMFYGMREEPGTVKWWSEQSDEAKARLKDPSPQTLALSLTNFYDWIKVHCDPAAVQVWSNGAAFDLPFISDAARRAGLPVPWNYWNERDTRTLMMVAESVMTDPGYEAVRTWKKGVAHSALDDAKNQALQMQMCWDAIQERVWR
jgi:DNA polymerase III epsilon subunit-like protein